MAAEQDLIAFESAVDAYEAENPQLEATYTALEIIRETANASITALDEADPDKAGFITRYNSAYADEVVAYKAMLEALASGFFTLAEAENVGGVAPFKITFAYALTPTLAVEFKTAYPTVNTSAYMTTMYVAGSNYVAPGITDIYVKNSSQWYKIVFRFDAFGNLILVNDQALDIDTLGDTWPHIALREIIEATDTLLAATTAGINVGQYSAETRAALEAELILAKAAYSNASTTSAEAADHVTLLSSLTVDYNSSQLVEGSRAEAIQALRMMLADEDPTQNILNKFNQKYSNQKLEFFLRFALRDVNSTSPRTTYANIEDFPDQDILVLGAVVFILMSEGILQVRNQLDYNDSGLAIAMFNKTSMYQAWATTFLNMYIMSKTDYKRSVIGSSFGSGFVGIRSNMSPDWGYYGC